MMMMRECFSERAVELQERICIWFEGKLSLGAFSQNIQFAPQPCMKGLLNDFPAKYLNLSDFRLSGITGQKYLKLQAGDELGAEIRQGIDIPQISIPNFL